ncbi:MAG: hypothetical protein AB8H79_12100 [Myxococcota bacterium]
MSPPLSYNLSGSLLIIAGITTGFTSAILAMVLLFLGVGALWLGPLFIALRSFVWGIRMVMGTPLPGGRWQSIMGAICSAMSFDVVGLILHISAIVLLSQKDAQAFMAAPVPSDDPITTAESTVDLVGGTIADVFA